MGGPGVMNISAFQDWLSTGERGISSETIVTCLTGISVGHYDGYPHDPADLRRCELLLRSVPGARVHFTDVMRHASHPWSALVDAWGELVALLEKEVPGAFSDRQPYGRAPRTFARMRDLIDGGGA